MLGFEDFMDIPRYRTSMQWEARAGRASVGVRHSVFSPGTIVTPPTSYSALVLYRRPTVIRQKACGEDRPSRQFIPGDLVLRPSGTGYAAESDNPLEVTVFCMDDTLVQAATTAFGANVSDLFGRLEARPFRSPLVEALAGQLANLAEQAGDSMHADALTSAIIHELWRMTAGADQTREGRGRQLSGHTLRRIDTEIDNALAVKLSLEDLASSVGMSMPAFAAAMKASTGQTPYQYVLSRRVDQARAMVETTPLSLAEIAFRCGFSSQSHMTDVFRAKLGATPGRLRSAKA